MKFIILFLFPSILFAATSSKCPGEQGYFYTNDKSKRNPRKGGFVSNSANVGDYVFIAPTAAVCQSASVLKFSRVYGNAIVRGEAEVNEKARVYGNAIVEGEAVVSGEAKVSGYAKVKGSSTVNGKAWIKGHIVLTSGTYSKGKHSASAPKSFIASKNAKQAAQSAAEKAKDQRQLQTETKYQLESFQRDLKQGWFGEDKRQGFYRSFKFYKSDVKPPCGFYLKLQKEERTLDSHCRRTKRVYNPKWILKKEKYKTVKDCKTQFDDQGEKFFDLKKLKVKEHVDFSHNKSYLEFNNYYFYVGGGNGRKVREYGEKLKKFARKYCGYKG